MKTWRETQIWKQLDQSTVPDSDEVRALLIQQMPAIELILTAAGTTPPDFTLHDAEHSWRVAERMVEIIPGETLEKLSVYELALLLLSAYLHDIGMSPEQAHVQRHWSHLVFGSNKAGLSLQEAEDFQRWLDDDGRGIEPPLAAEGSVNEGQFRLAAELITHYCRHRHNDWSETWIRSNLATHRLGGYGTWIDALVRICRSHHDTYEDLIQPAFDPQPVGRDAVVHLRYLACVLRVADILDVDPERTPPVIFYHRSISTGSIIYWQKDQELSIHHDGSTLIVYARPSSAAIENAIRATAQVIGDELRTCARISRERPFDRCTFRTAQHLPHQWKFPESHLIQIQPNNGAYVYIEGAFRPNTSKLLELLSGTQLYGNPLAAVRELIQNAFDATKEQMALERLRWKDPKDPHRSQELANLNHVSLRMEEQGERLWLICSDSGAGMTRRIIENYLLVSGNSRRHEILELERRCIKAGFRLGRTGQFGIGVLSYFMLADHAEIRTRRSTSHGDAEAHGWKFETEGVGSFGELTRHHRADSGTEVRLRIRPEIAQDCATFSAQLTDYLREILV